MNPALVLPIVDLRPLLPMLVLAATAVVVILLDLLPPRERKDHLGFVSALGDRVYILEKGMVRYQGSMAEFLADEQVRQAYLAV